MPSINASIEDVLEIVQIRRVGSVFVELEDGRIYATIGGKSLFGDGQTHIVPATDVHREALRGKRRHKP